MRSKVEPSFIVLLGLLIGLSPLAVDMYLPGMPAIGADLGASPHAVQQTLSIYLACFAIPQLIFGPISDAYGRRLTIILGLGVFILGGLWCSFARDIQELLMARGLQGIGAASLIVTVPALVRDRTEGSEFARIMGFVMMVMAVAPLVAPIAGGLLLKLSGWRLIFWTLAALAALGLVLFHWRIGETLAPERRVPLRPASLVRNYASLFRQRQSLCFMLCAALVFAGMMTFLAASPFVYIELYGISEQHYGFVFALNILAMTGFTAISSRFVLKTGSHRMLGIGMVVVLLASIFLLVQTPQAKPPVALLIAAIVLFVSTNGVVNANAQALVMSRFGHISGSASAMVGSFRFGAGALSSVVVGALYDGTVFPLLVVMAGCGLLAVLFFGLASLPEKSAQ